MDLKHKFAKWVGGAVAVLALATAATRAGGVFDGQDGRDDDGARRRAKNVILFIGDGMGVSTVTATRVYSVGVAGQLVVDQFPYTALSRTYSLGFDHARQRADDDGDDDGEEHQRRRAGVGRDDRVRRLQQRRRRQTPSDAPRAGQAQRHESRCRQHGAHHPRHPGRHLRPHQQPRQRERHRAAVVAHGRDLQPGARRRDRRDLWRRTTAFRAELSPGRGIRSRQPNGWTRPAGRVSECGIHLHRQHRGVQRSDQAKPPGAGPLREQPHGVGVGPRHRCGWGAQPHGYDPQIHRPSEAWSAAARLRTGTMDIS